MSRVGKNAVVMPQGVTAELKQGKLTVKGKLGTLSMPVMPEVEVKIEGNEIVVTKTADTKTSQMMWGTTRNNAANLVKGVAEGFTKTLEIEGVGYRAAVQGKDVVLQLGYSHEIKYPIPEGIEIKAIKPTLLTVSGADKQKVGQVSAEIRSMRKPEPYKGKGIHYQGEYIRRKEGKKK
ncbi:MAG: 50S ribosomal protein L6 [Bdellovibrionales bacterium]